MIACEMRKIAKMRNRRKAVFYDNDECDHLPAPMRIGAPLLIKEGGIEPLPLTRGDAQRGREVVRTHCHFHHFPVKYT